MAASEHGKLLFVMRPAQAQSESSPAVLRLLASLQPGGDGVQLEILKRKGPPLAQPLQLPARPARLAALLAQGGPGRLRLPGTAGSGLTGVPQGATRPVDAAPTIYKAGDALARVAAAA
jgi:protein ImuA